MYADRRDSLLQALREFVETPLDVALERHIHEDPLANTLALFHRTAARVPAYASLLAAHGIEPSSITTPDDVKRLPVLTKQSYIKRYPLASLCRDGDLSGCDMIAVSSGSTGEPTFWPRFAADELSVALRFEQVFHDGFRADERRTLAVVCFALGTWVGGMYTAGACRHLAAKGYPITVITPGNNKDEIFRAVQALGAAFDQTVLLGYPPFLKDVIDTGLARGVAWERYRIKMVLAGEVFSEEWRSLVGERAGAEDVTRDVASLYGTADAGVLGNETPLSVRIRRFLASRPDAARAIFGEPRLPTLVQYDPLHRYFEAAGRALIFSGDNGVPLVRYDILDTGGVVSYDEMRALLLEWGFDPAAELEGTRGARRLPFVFVFGRSDFTVSYFGANIYPENVTVGLEQPGIKEWVTGKFVLTAREDQDRNRTLSVVVELSPGVLPKAGMRRVIAASIEEHLTRLNSEFANYVPAGRRTPLVELAGAGDPQHFPVGVKHKYTKR